MLLCAALLGACAVGEAPEPAVRMTLQRAHWSAAQLDAIYDAAARWNEVSTRPIAIVEVPSGAGVSIVPATTASLGADRMGHASGSSIFVRTDQPIETMHETTLHELGHRLGLGHVGKGVMSTGDWHGLQFSDEDLAMCRRAGACEE